LPDFLILGQKASNGQKMVKMAPKQKNKTTLFSPTFLVEIMKVVLDFSFEAIWATFLPHFDFWP
jgi:hypothetical protein